MSETYAAFLRAINVGGRRVTMADLRTHLEALEEVEVIDTYLASGNVSFRSALDAGTLEQRFAAHLEDALGFDVPTIVRSVAELQAIVDSDVFADQAASSDYKLYVTLLSEPLTDTTVLTELGNEVDTFQLVDRDVFWLRDMNAGESMNNYDLEKAIGIVGTRRTINTIAKIARALTA